MSGTISSGLANMMKSMFNIDPAEMQAAAVGFQTVMTDIQQHLLVIEKEQARQGAIIDRIHQMNGGLPNEHSGTVRGIGGASGSAGTSGNGTSN
jgi:hypothetical protein